MYICRLLLAGLSMLVAQAAMAQPAGPEIAYCVDRKTLLSTVPEAQMKMSFPASCVLSKTGSARAFLEINYGGVNRNCRC